MPALLLVLALAALAIGFHWRGMGLRQSPIYASIPVSLFLVFTTEGLSAFHAVTATGLEICWAGFVVAGLAWSMRQRQAQSPSTRIWTSLRGLETFERVLLSLTALVAGLVALTALLSAPNTWDAMEYHMPRVVEWIVHRGVQLYPTIDRQQLSMPPFSEYVILHLQLLYGADRFANLVQWLAYVGCMLAASLIARELGGGRRAQVLAAVVSATIETGILGASGAKNDYVMSYWVATAVLLLLQWKRRQDWALTLGISSALALAVFSKGTAYAFLPPLVLFCFVMWGWKARKLFLLRLPVLALVCVAVSGPLWARNHAYSGSILGLPYFDGAGPNDGRLYGNGHITPARSLANVIRNVGLNLAVPNRRVNALTVKVLSGAIRALGVDPNDYYQLVHAQDGSLPPFNVEWQPRSETQSGNQAHFLLLVAAGIFCAWNWRKFNRNILLFGCGLIFSFALYAALLRWSPWNARYQLPVFVLGAAFVAIVLERLLPQTATVVVASCLLLVAFPLSFMNLSRPLYDRKYSIVSNPRERTYFYDNHWQYADSHIQAAKSVAAKECRSVGIDANLMHFEYPMMALVNRDGQQRQVSYMSVQNSTVAYKQANVAPPCTVVCLGCRGSQPKWREYHPQFKTVETYGDVLVFSGPSNSAGVTTSAGLITH